MGHIEVFRACFFVIDIGTTFLQRRSDFMRKLDIGMLKRRPENFLMIKMRMI